MALTTFAIGQKLIHFQNLSQFVRTHEKALANALQIRSQVLRNGQAAGQTREAPTAHISSHQSSAPTSSTSNAFAAALSLGTLSFGSHTLKSAKLTLTPHHLFYLLSRFEETGLPIGPMNVRLENIHAETSPANYVSFLSESQRSKGRSDRDSIHSVSSVRSVMTGMSALWSTFGINSNSAGKSEKSKAQMMVDLKYLYSAFTKIPCLRLSTDRKARLIGGYEEFPFDTAVPLLCFKNLSALEICDIDFRQFFGWDRLAEQLRSLTIRRGNVEDPTDLFTGIVLDDMDKRRRRSSKAQSSPILSWPLSPSPGRFISAPCSPVADEKLAQSTSPQNPPLIHYEDAERLSLRQRPRNKSISPIRPTSSRQESSFRYPRGTSNKIKRSGSGSSNSSSHSGVQHRTGSSSNLLSVVTLPVTKWRFLRHLSLADNSLTTITQSSLFPLANTLHSLDLSSNLFVQIPDNLATLTALRALNLSYCMIESLHSLSRNPLPAITALNLRANRLASIAGIERLLSLERLDLRDNKIKDPTEAARLTGIPNSRELWITGNPLIKTHSNYRVTIFNLFRTTPGLVEDIILDGSGPGYSERRQLKDRVCEPESVPVLKPLPVSETDRSISCDKTPPNAPPTAEPNIERRPRPPLQSTQSDLVGSSSRRKKGPRRRIVDLSREEGTLVNPLVLHQDISPILPGAHMLLNPDLRDNQPELDSSSTPQCQDSSSPGITDVPPPRPSSITSAFPSHTVYASPESLNQNRPPANEPKNTNVNGDAYRQKVEALKNEVGNTWLNVLTEDGWHEHGKSKLDASDFERIHARRGLPNLQNPNPRILSSNRTLS